LFGEFSGTFKMRLACEVVSSEPEQCGAPDPESSAEFHLAEPDDRLQERGVKWTPSFRPLELVVKTGLLFSGSWMLLVVVLLSAVE